MEAPLMGEHGVLLREVRAVDIHGARFLDLAFVLDGDAAGTVHTCRIGPESVAPDPQPGERMRATFVLRQPTRVWRTP